MSKIKLPHASGNSMSIGAPATNPASDLTLTLPATIGTSGQYLTVDGSGNLVWADPPGITHVDAWRLPANITGAALPITNWERVDTSTNGFGHGFLGTGFDPPSSGAFNFPVTGIWKVEFHAVSFTDDEERYFQASIGMSGNSGSTWEDVAYGYGNHYDESGTTYSQAIVTIVVDVTNTTTQSVRFGTQFDASASDGTSGGTNDNYTHVLFTRLGAT